MKAKSNSVISTEIAEQKVLFTVAGVATLELELEKLSEEVFKRAAIHGLIQRVCDAAAISRNTETGQSATPTDKYEAMKELVDFYNSGTTEWRRTSSGAGSGENGGLLRKCLVKLYPEKTEERIAEFLKGLTRKEKLALLNTEAVKKIADEFRVKSTNSADAEKLLSGL